MFTYRAYHLNVNSEIELPTVAVTDSDPALPEVTIRRGSVPPHLANDTPENVWFEVAPDRVLLTIDEAARYLIADGCSVTVEPFPGADPDLVRLFLLGSAMGALLYQRGLLPLHGSAVETRLGAMVFIGPQGIGKSTLAAQFRQRGYRILSDDVSAISTDCDGQLQVLPAFPKLRLCPDALERLERSSGQLKQARFDGDKFVVPVSSGYCSSPVPLASIHLLSEGPESGVAIQPFRGFGRIEQLLGNLYRAEYLRGLASEGRVMELALRVAREVPLVEVAHDRDPARLDRLIDELARAWGEKGIFS